VDGIFGDQVIPFGAPFSWGCLPPALQTLTLHQAIVSTAQQAVAVILLMVAGYGLLSGAQLADAAARSFKFRRTHPQLSVRERMQLVRDEALQAEQARQAQAEALRQEEAEEHRRRSEAYERATRPQIERQRREDERRELWRIMMESQAREEERQARLRGRQFQRGVRELRRLDWRRRWRLVSDGQMLEADTAVLMFFADSDGLTARNAAGRAIRVRTPGQRFPERPFVVLPSAHVALDTETEQPIDFVEAGQVSPTTRVELVMRMAESATSREFIRKRDEFLKVEPIDPAEFDLFKPDMFWGAAQPKPANVFLAESNGRTIRSLTGEVAEVIEGEGDTFIVAESAERQADNERQGIDDQWTRRPAYVRHPRKKTSQRPPEGGWPPLAL